MTSVILLLLTSILPTTSAQTAPPPAPVVSPTAEPRLPEPRQAEEKREDPYRSEGRLFGGLSNAFQEDEKGRVGFEYQLAMDGIYLDLKHSREVDADDKEHTNTQVRYTFSVLEPRPVADVEKPWDFDSGFELRFARQEEVGLSHDITLGFYAMKEFKPTDWLLCGIKGGPYYNSQAGEDAEASAQGAVIDATAYCRISTEDDRLSLEASIRGRQDIGGKRGDERIGHNMFWCTVEAGYCFSEDRRWKLFGTWDFTKLGSGYDTEALKLDGDDHQDFTIGMSYLFGGRSKVGIRR